MTPKRAAERRARPYDDQGAADEVRPGPTCSRPRTCSRRGGALGSREVEISEARPERGGPPTSSSGRAYDDQPLVRARPAVTDSSSLVSC